MIYRKKILLNLLLFLAIWSVWLSFYQGITFLSLLEWESFFGTAVLSLGLTILMRNQKVIGNKATLISSLVLFIPIVMCLVVGSNASPLIICVPAALFLYSILSPNRELSLTQRLAGSSAYSLIYILFCYSAFHENPYFDAWQINSYAQSYMTDFNRIDFVRQNYIDTHYGMGFPYMLTLLVFIAWQLTQWGIFAYLVSNFAALLISALLIKRIFCQVEAPRLWPFVTMLITLFFYFTNEVQKGGSTVIIFPIMLSLFSILLTCRNDWAQLLITRRALAIGALLGMGLMIRFDFVAFTGSAMFFYILYAISKRHYKSACFAVFSCFLLIAPWMLYSIVHFDHIFITDNGQRLINIPDTRTTTYFSSEMPPETIFTHPRDWAYYMFFQSYSMCKELGRYVIGQYYLPLLFVIGLIISIKQGKAFYTCRINRAIALISFFSLCVILLIISVRFFFNERYYAPYISFFMLSVFLMMRCLRWRYYASISLCMISLSLYHLYEIKLLSNSVIKQLIIPKNNFEHNLSHKMTLSAHEASVQQHILRVNKDAKICAADSNNLSCPKFAALSGLAFYHYPTNIQSCRQFMYYVRDFELNYYYNDQLPPYLQEAIDAQVLIPESPCGLYRIDLKRIALAYPDLLAAE